MFNGLSLNDHWVNGPDLIDNMLGILPRFRKDQIAKAGDIKKMYHSICHSWINTHIAAYGEIRKLIENQINT